MIKIFTAFSGYDSQCLALQYLGYDFDLVGWSEIDKYAIRAHDVLFPQFRGRNYGDISRIDWSRVPDFDLFTYSSPCQDFSNAGLQKGGEEGSGTRSSLLWECKKAIKEKHPRWCLMENVKALVSKKFLPTLNLWLEWLRGEGYENYVQVLNAKDYGIPQNRERVFVVSVLGGGSYNFPHPIPLEKCVGDVLEEDVPERYYLNQEKVNKFVAQLAPEKLQKIEDEK